MDGAMLGNSGVRVSRLALGLAFRGQTDESLMEATIHRALDRGITFFDCANDYGRTSTDPYGGPAERTLGRAIVGRRDEVVLTTKVGFDTGPGPNDSGGSRLHIMREIERSLGRLATDHVDIYLVHVRDPNTGLEETVTAMMDVVRQGKARAWGICNFQAWEGATALHLARGLGGTPPILMQNPYNLLNRSVETDSVRPPTTRCFTTPNAVPRSSCRSSLPEISGRRPASRPRQATAASGSVAPQVAGDRPPRGGPAVAATCR